jgi:AcrR family transcriptional regulator
MADTAHPTSTPPRGRPRDPARDARILEAAVALIGEVGYDRMTVDAIAERAGVSKPTIYRRWAGKREIVADAIRHRKEHDVDADTGTLRGDLLALVQALAASIAGEEDAQIVAGITSLLRSSDEFAALFRERAIAPERARWARLVQRAVDRGEIAPDAPVTELFGDVAPAIVFTRVMVAREPVDDAFVEELVDRVLLPILPLTDFASPERNHVNLSV